MRPSHFFLHREGVIGIGHSVVLLPRKKKLDSPLRNYLKKWNLKLLDPLFYTCRRFVPNLTNLHL